MAEAQSYHLKYFQDIDTKFSPSNQNFEARDVSNALKGKPFSDFEALRDSTMEFTLEDTAGYLSRFMGNLNADKIEKEYEIWVTSQLIDENGNERTNIEFSEHISGKSNPVFTGHPTWAATPDQEKALSEYFNHLSGNLKFGPETKNNLKESAPTQFQKPTLEEENNAIMFALHNSEWGRLIKERVHVRVAAKKWPETYREYNYSSGATGDWGVLDYDGRADISAFRSFAKRIRLKTDKLDNVIAPLLRKLDDEGAFEGLETEISELRNKISYTQGIEKKLYRKLKKYNPSDDKGLRKIQKLHLAMEESLGDRVTSAGEIIDLLDRAISNDTASAAVIQELVVLRGALKERGLMLAQPHSRLNSKKIQTALKSEGIPIDDENTDYPSHDEAFLPKLEKFIIALDEKKSLDSNLLTLAMGPKSAIEQLLLHGLGAKFLDENQKGFQLIADTKNKLTVMGMVYFAAKFDILEHTNLMPLIEEVVGQENAVKIFKTLGRDPKFKNNVALSKSVNVLTGLSDITRQQGLFSALYQENVVLDFLKQAKENYPDDTVINVYPCGGSDIDRGRHVGSLQRELEHSLFPKAIEKAKDLGISNRLRFMIAEQGQTAFYKYSTVEAAFKCHTEQTKHMLKDHSAVKNDILYKKNKSTLAMSKTVFDKTYALQTNDTLHEAMALEKEKNPSNGSRPVTHATRAMMRAIQQSNTSKRMGACMSALYALNTARKTHPDLFATYFEKSETFKRFIEISDIALDKTNTQTLRDTIEMYKPEKWFDAAKQYPLDSDERKAHDKLAKALEKQGYYAKFRSLIGEVAREIDEWQEYRNQSHNILPPLKNLAYEPNLNRDFTEKVVHGMRMQLTEQKWLLWFSIPDHGQETPKRSDLDAQFLAGKAKAVETMDEIFDAPLNEIEIIHEIFAKTVREAKEENLGYSEVQGKIDDIRKINQQIVHTSAVLNNTSAGLG